MSELTAAITPSPCFEWVAFAGGLPGVNGREDQPAPLRPGAVESSTAGLRPGAVIRDQGGVLGLHYAPTRWLIPEPDVTLLTALKEAQSSGQGLLTDVTGRWRVLRASAAKPSAVLQPPMPHALSAGMPVELYLRGRDVAALWLFDCPVLVVRGDSNFEIWVEASYEAGFRDAYLVGHCR